MKLSIDHLVVVSQDVEVPDTCPECQADLTEERALKLWEFQDQSRYMTTHHFDKESYWCIMVEKCGKWERWDKAIYHEREVAEGVVSRIPDDFNFKVANIPEDGYEIECCDDLPQSGESFRSCSWHCASCNNTLVVHNERLFDMDDSERMPPSGVLDLLKIDAKPG
jgi:hypothetical protein